MPTPKFDNICVEFIGRIPTTFKTSFTPGTMTMPDSWVLPASQITNYVNRALQKFFNDYWKMFKGDLKYFLKFFPELGRIPSYYISFSSGKYFIDNPQLDLHTLIGAFSLTSNYYIKVWDQELYSSVITGRFPERTPTTEKPAIIMADDYIYIFPDDFAENVQLHYLQKPVDSTTGGFLSQNGSYDSPFNADWQTDIVNEAYLMYLNETQKT